MLMQARFNQHELIVIQGLFQVHLPALPVVMGRRCAFRPQLEDGLERERMTARRWRGNLLILAAIIPMVLAAIVVTVGIAIVNWIFNPRWYIWLPLSPIVYLAWVALSLRSLASASRRVAARHPKARQFAIQTGPGAEQSPDPGATTVLALAFRFQFVSALPLARVLAVIPLFGRLVLRAYSPSISIGTDAKIFGLLTDPDITEIGDGAIIGRSAELVAHAMTRRPDGRLAYISAPIKVGKFATVGGAAYVSLGSVIGDRAVVEPKSFVPPFTNVPEGETWGGNPVQCRRRADGTTVDTPYENAGPAPAATVPEPSSGVEPGEEELWEARCLVMFALGLRPADVPNELSAETCQAWDSLGQVSIATALYDRNGIAVGSETVFRLRSLRDVALAMAGQNPVRRRSPSAPLPQVESQSEERAQPSVTLPSDIEMLPLLDGGKATSALANSHADRRAAPESVKVVIAASSTVRSLESPLRVWGRAFGLEIECEFAGFNQVAQVLLSPTSEFSANEGGVNIVLLDPTDRCFEENSQMLSVVDQMLAAIESWSRRQPSGSRTLVGTLPQLVSAFGSIDQSLYEEARYRWRTVLEAIHGIRIFDFAGVVAQLGTAAAQNSEGEALSRMPYSAAVYQAAGIALVRQIMSTRRSSAKVIAVDCDNTLWGGVLGETGFDGIKLGPDGAGRSFQLFQHYLKQLKDRGLLLAIVSKNEEAEVLGVFEQHPEMVLRPGDISAWKVNWKHKSENLQELAEELNLGINSFVFLDDDAAVRREVSMRLPEIHVVPLPDNPSHYCETLQKLWLFDGAEPTEGDRKRTQMIQEETVRKGAQRRAASLEEYLSDLNLEVEMAPPSDAEWPRVAQLTQRTNQFNLSLKRRTIEEVKAAAAKGFALVVKARDRFGEYGLVGACLCRMTEPGICEIDSLLMSCRVLGRGVEESFLHALSRYAQDRGAGVLSARFVSGPRNSMVKGFLTRSGFAEITPDNWQLPVATLPAMPSHVRWLGAVWPNSAMDGTDKNGCESVLFY
jgi:FkbH-like protein